MIDHIPPPPRPNRRPMSDVVGTGFEVYSTLKMGLFGYQAWKRAIDRGASQEEAITAGITAAIAWMTFVFVTLGSLLFLIFVSITPLIAVHQGSTRIHAWVATAVAFALGGVITICWLVLYSRLKNLLASVKRGRLYKWGFRLDRKFHLLEFPAWGIGGVMLLTATPITALINITTL